MGSAFVFPSSGDFTRQRLPCSFLSPSWLPCPCPARGDLSPPPPLQNFLSRTPRSPFQPKNHSHQRLWLPPQPFPSHRSPLQVPPALSPWAAPHGIPLLSRDARGSTSPLPTSRNHRLPEELGSPSIPGLMELPCCLLALGTRNCCTELALILIQVTLA